MPNELPGPDPNIDKNDPMIPEYWRLGEDIQDRIRVAGFEAPQVEGIAVDIHDLLQAADRIRDEICPRILEAGSEQLPVLLAELADEFRHVRWHCLQAEHHLSSSLAEL